MSNDREERKPDRFTPEEPETEIRDDKEDILEETGSLEQSEVQEETPGEGGTEQTESGADGNDPEEDDPDYGEEQEDEDGDTVADEIQNDTRVEGEADKMSENIKKRKRRRRRKGSMGKKPWIIAGSIA